MFQQFENQQKATVDATLKSFAAVSRGLQAILTELTDYAKHSSEQQSALVQKLMGARSPEKAVEVYTETVKTNFDGMVSLSSKLTDLYSNIAKEAVKPLEGAVANAKSNTVSSVKAAA